MSRSASSASELSRVPEPGSRSSHAWRASHGSIPVTALAPFAPLCAAAAAATDSAASSGEPTTTS